MLFELADSPISVLCQVTTVDASNTRLEGEGVTDAMAGVVQEFTVILYDSGDNRLEIGGDTLVVGFSPPGAAIEIFDNGEGSYRVQYRITVAGEYTLSVQINLDTVNVKTRTTTVVPNEAFPPTSTLTFNPIVQVDIQESMSVEIYDEY